MLDLSVKNARPPVPSADFIKNEILRVGAPAEDLKTALAFVASESGFDPHAYDALPPRMRRLVDLLAVAGDSISTVLIETPQEPDPAVA